MFIVPRNGIDPWSLAYQASSDYKQNYAFVRDRSLAFRIRFSLPIDQTIMYTQEKLR